LEGVWPFIWTAIFFATSAANGTKANSIQIILFQGISYNPGLNRRSDESARHGW
jgi:hypothetical protein